MKFLDLFWIFIVIALVLPILQRKLLDSRRLGAMRAIERRRKSRVIAMVHRQETMSLLGFPIMRLIDINDAEEVMRAVRLTDDDVPRTKERRRSSATRPRSPSSCRTTPCPAGR